MAENVWPPSLPQYPLASSRPTRGRGDQTIRSTTQDGPFEVRPRNTGRPKPLNATYPMDAAQYEAFENFHDVTLCRGALPFDLPDWRKPGAIREVRILDFQIEDYVTIDAALQVEDKARVALTFEQLP